ncbi:protein amalgam isoform X1 [Folsomia candida]|uniref:protein amalgam isoform X1 n=2 Tax=Folsomia candida TaxID=158441 RepID=UPI000B8FD013|nr:protein amalgam isoform X1 [Folsomia candida]
MKYFGFLYAHSTLSVLGVCAFLSELCRCQIHNGVRGKWPPFSKPKPHSETETSEEDSKLPHPLKLNPHSHFMGSANSLQLAQIHSPQTKLTVQIGDNVQLPCKVHNLGENHVLWRHGTNILAGSNITKYADNRIDMLQDFTLVISKVNRSDEGDYECIVTTWPSLSIVHSIVVHDPPTVSLLTPTNLIVTEGESLEIGCLPSGKPLPKVVWSMRDGNMPLVLHKTFLNQARLPLSNVTRDYTGLWVCTADNGVGRPAIGAVYIRVLYSPEIEIPRRRAHGGQGYKVQLVGLVHADPKPEVRWRKNGTLISNSDRDDRVQMELYERNEYRLVFNSVKPSDFATYSIEANNSLGVDMKNIEFLGVPDIPILTRWEAEDVDGIQVTLYWAVECYSSLIEYKLFFRPATIPPADDLSDESALIKLAIPADKFSDTGESFLHTKSFTLRGLNRSSIYQAAVQARNKYGWSLLSSLCYFATFPNSSSTKSLELEQVMSKMKTAYRVETGFTRDGGSAQKSTDASPPSSSSSVLLSPGERSTILVLWAAIVVVGSNAYGASGRWL